MNIAKLHSKEAVPIYAPTNRICKYLILNFLILPDLAGKNGTLFVLICTVSFYIYIILSSRVNELTLHIFYLEYGLFLMNL